MRMYLMLDAPLNPDPTLNNYEIHQIFEFDMDSALTDGIVSWSTYGNNRPVYNPNDGDSIWYDDFIATSATLNRYLSTNIPNQPYMAGDIFEASMSPYVQEEGIWVPNPSYYSMDAIPVGERPPDWGIASNIFIYTYPAAFTYDNVEYRYQCWTNVRRNATYDSSALYYRDTARKMIKMFYTMKGYSFTLYRGGGRSGSSSYSPFRYTTGGDCLGSDTSLEGYCFTNSSNAKLRKYNSGSSGVRSDINGNTYLAGGDENKAKILTGDYPDYGAKCAIFIHFTHDGKDFYGIGELNYASYSEQAVPVSMRVMAFTTDFWGDSIIAGGGGGSWGPISIPGGGEGTFEITRQDNRGDPDGHGVADRADAIRNALDPFFTGANGLRLHQLLSAAIPDIYSLLYADTSGAFLRRYEQSMYNPLSAIISVHMLPQKLVLFTGNSTDLTASGYNISNNLPTPQTFPVVSHTASYPPKIDGVYGEGLESFDFGKYFDAFPDFAPYTQIRLHLPYCGVIDIDTNLVMHGTLQVSYICDAISGNVAAYVYCKDREGHETYSYVATGNAAFSLPMFAAQQDGSSVGKLGMSLVGLGIGAAMGNAAGIAGGIAGAAGAVFDAATAHRTTQIAGQYTGNVGALTDTVCWLEITRPCWVDPDNFQLLHGETSQIGGTISNYSDGMPYKGFLKVQQIDADGIQATRAEIEEIEQLLMAGIYVNEQ